MRTSHRTALLAAAALLAAGPALAQPGPGAGPRAERGERGFARMFETLDANRDGRITFEEAWAATTERFRAADTDRSGALSLEQFANLRPRPSEAPALSPEREARRAERQAAKFRALDANRDGRVTLEELRVAEEMRFRARDANGDGAITRDEVRRAEHRGDRRGHAGHEHGRHGREGGRGHGPHGTPPSGR